MRITLLPCIILLGVLHGSAGEIRSEVEEIIKEDFGSVQFQFKKQVLEKDLRQNLERAVQQKFFGEYVYVWNICKGDSLSGLAILDNVYGKSLPITFLVLFNADETVRKAVVIRYREPYGGAVKSGHWLSQFIGLSPADDFDVNKGVDSITGATISTRSMTLGIKKLIRLVPHLLQRPDACVQIKPEHVQKPE